MADPNDLDPRLAHLGQDLLLVPFFQAADGDQLDLATDPGGNVTRNDSVDFARAVGPGALRQALVLRLLTPLGSLSALAHPDYGSRLGELIGEISTPFTRARARAFVLEALAKERRVKEVLAIDVRSADGATDRLLIDVRVSAVTGGDPIVLGLEVAL
jgi:phage baseplate assembly protein W